MKTSTLLLSFLAFVTVCHSQPATSPLKGGLQDLLAASLQLRSWGETFLRASENGLDADELSRMKSSLSVATNEVKVAVEKVKDILGADELTVSQKKVLETIQKDLPTDNGSTLMALLMSDSLKADDIRLQIFSRIFKKRMDSLSVIIGRIRALLSQPGEPMTETVADVAKAVLADQTAVSLIIGAVMETFEDAEVVGRPLVRAAQQEESDDGQDQSSPRVRRSVPLSVGGWSLVGGHLRWRRKTCILVITGWKFLGRIRIAMYGKKCFYEYRTIHYPTPHQILIQHRNKNFPRYHQQLH